MIRFHPNITAAEAAAAVADAGFVTLPDWRGGGVIVRRSDAARLRGLADQMEALREAACLSTVELLAPGEPGRSEERHGTVARNIVPMRHRRRQYVGPDEVYPDEPALDVPA